MQAIAGTAKDFHQSKPSSRLTLLMSAAPWLTVVGFIFLFDIGISLIGLAVDHTVVGGMPAWMKPLKFSISTMLYSFNLAYLMRYFVRWGGITRVVEKVQAICLLTEILLIDVQAARHTASHFNVSTRLDGTIYMMMGIGIATVMFGNILLAVLSFLDPCRNRTWAWVIRLSLLIGLAGMSTGVLMTQPTPLQLAETRTAQKAVTIGSHTVGAKDGGRGIPLVGWSVDHGDLRIAHFVGLHSMQLLTLAALWCTTRIRLAVRSQLRLIATVAASCAGVYGIVLIQALRGQPFLNPDGTTYFSWAAWLLGTASCCLWTTATSSSEGMDGLQQGDRM